MAFLCMSRPRSSGSALGALRLPEAGQMWIQSSHKTACTSSPLIVLLSIHYRDGTGAAPANWSTDKFPAIPGHDDHDLSTLLVQVNK